MNGRMMESERLAKYLFRPLSLWTSEDELTYD
jgi:hypothetical protein